MPARHWIKFWNFTKNPFFTTPLMYNDQHFYELFTKTKIVEKIEPIFLDNIESSHLKKLVILGGRGSGKSTIINHLYLRFYNLKKRAKKDPKYSNYLSILPVFIEITEIASFDNEKLLSDALCNEILRGLNKSLKDEIINPNRDATHHFEKSIDRCKNNCANKYHCIEDIISKLIDDGYFSSIIIFIDNLDKATDDELIENWLSHAQGFFEGVLWRNNVHTVIVGGGLFIDKSYKDEYGWFFDDTFKIAIWEYSDIKDFIDKRLKYRTNLGDSYNLDKYIEGPALEEIFQRCLGHPRTCQSALKKAMEIAAKKDVKPINQAFVLSNKSIFEGVLGVNEKEIKNAYIEHLKSHVMYGTGFSRIVRLLNSSKVYTPTLIKDLMIMYRTNNFAKVNKQNDLKEYSIVELKTKKNEYWLDKDVYRVMQDILYYHCDGDEKKLEVFLSDLAR